MNKTSWTTVLALTIVLAPPAYNQTQPVSPVQNPPLPKAIEQVDALATAEDKIGGTTIGIVSGGKLVWTKSYGYADTKNKVPTTKDHVFGIASITKQFTALMLLQLVEQGKVHLSDPVEKYVPEVNKLRNRFEAAPPITLIQLATHTSGLDREPDDDKLVYGAGGPVSEWDKKLIGTIPLTRFIYEPGTRYSYSNIGYAILGLALSRAAGEPYLEYVEKRILKPLGMSHTSFVLDDQMEKNRARGFLIENGNVDTEEPERQIRAGRGWRVPNGGLYSTVEDLARFVAFELGEEHADVLSKKSLEANFERVNSALTEFTYGYGIGFQARRRGNFVAVGHDGVLAGYQCSAWIDRTTRLGVITLTTKQEKFLGFRALEILANANRPVNTAYFGGYGVPGAFSRTQLTLVDTGGVVSGEMRQPFDRADTPALQNLITNGEKLTFNVDHLYFVLHRTAYGYSGFVRDQKSKSEQKAEFIEGLPPVPSQILAAYEGTYQIDRRRTLTLSRNSGGSGFWYLELPSGRTGSFYTLSNNWPNIEFTAGPCIYCIKPEYLHVRFEQDHGEIGKTLQVQLGGLRYTARRLTSYREEEVTFTSADGTRLSGSLFIPAGKSRHPAVVFAHGSNAQTRNGFYGHIRFLAEAYARRGIAALAFDKRGTGKSQGDWDSVLFDTLAADVAAGVHYLRTRPDIRPDRIGLTGSSQAGVIMPIAAALVPDVRFIQVRSGGVLSVREQERRRIILQMKADKSPQSEIDRALRMRDMMDDYAVNGKNWEAMEAYAKTVEKEYWMTQFIGGFPAKDANDWAWLREAFGYHLGPYYSRFRGSWHILFADLDTATPTRETKIQTEIALREGNSRDITIEVVPRATHNYMLARTGADREFPGLTRFVPGIYDRIVGWAVLRMR